MIAPYPARWLLTEMAAGRTVTKASAARHAKWLAEHGGDEGRRFAFQILAAFQQLESSAMDGEPGAPAVLQRVVRDLPRSAPAPEPEPDGAA